MYRLKVSAGFAAAHYLREYKGKCENLHGHNWKVEATVSSPTLDGCGMVIDFGELKRILGELVAGLDHRCLNEHPDFQVMNPTSENLARYLAGALAAALAGRPLRVDSVAVEETAGSIAVYETDDL
jgi:6-pyruvoyltetrahydropterin/6-carboxytetrahydropterin synthase